MMRAITAQAVTPELLALFDVTQPTPPRTLNVLGEYRYVWYAKNSIPAH